MISLFAQLPGLQAQRFSDKTAIRFAGKNLSYTQFEVLVNSQAAALHEQGVQAGDRVAYLGWNSPEQVALLFACARVGAILVPLNTRLAVPEWITVLSDCAPRLLLHTTAWKNQARELARVIKQVACIEHLQSASQTLQTGSPSDSSPALLVYTSGTTGIPKGAVHTQANLMANMAIAAEFIGLSAINVVATMLPLFHVGGLCIQTLPALYAGATVLLHERFEAGAALRCFHQERPSTTLQVPATMKALIEHPAWASTDLSSLAQQGLWAGSSTLPAHLIEAFHARGVPVCNVYGSTETGPFSIALPALQAQHKVGSCGWPAHPDVRVKLLNPKNGIGELAIASPNVADRYWPGTALKDADGYFHTGDLASVAPDGSYSIVGRCKDMLISGGENIYPAELENIIAAHPSVLECAVVGLPDAEWGEVVAACLVLKPEAKAAQIQNELSLQLEQKLSRYKFPKHWFFAKELPKTALGKIQKDTFRATLLLPST